MRGTDSRWVSLILVQAMPAKSYYEAHDIRSEGGNARDCTNEVVSFRKFKFILSIKINEGDWEKLIVVVADTVL